MPRWTICGKLVLGSGPHQTGALGGAVRDKVAMVASAGRSRCDVVIVDIICGADNVMIVVGGEDIQAISRLTLAEIPGTGQVTA